jgi:hypothetical protein
MILIGHRHPVLKVLLTVPGGSALSAGPPGAYSAISTSGDPQGVSGGLATLAGLPGASRSPFCDSGSSNGSGGSASSASLPDPERMPSSSKLSSRAGVLWLLFFQCVRWVDSSGLIYADQENGEPVEHLVEP